MGYDPKKHYTVMKHHIVAAKADNAKHFIISKNRIMVLRIAGGDHKEMEKWLDDYGAIPLEDVYSYFREYITTQELTVLFVLRWA